jgi:GTP cyclohydrolase FolE2
MSAWVDGTVGLQRVVEIGLRVAPTAACASSAASVIVQELESSLEAPVRIVSVGAEGNRIVVTLAITMGSTADVTTGAPAARRAVNMVARLIESLSDYDPSFTTLPNPDSVEALIGSKVEQKHEILDRAMCVLAGQA